MNDLLNKLLNFGFTDGIDESKGENEIKLLKLIKPGVNSVLNNLF